MATKKQAAAKEARDARAKAVDAEVMPAASSMAAVKDPPSTLPDNLLPDDADDCSDAVDDALSALDEKLRKLRRVQQLLAILDLSQPETTDRWEVIADRQRADVSLRGAYDDIKAHASNKELAHLELVHVKELQKELADLRKELGV